MRSIEDWECREDGTVILTSYNGDELPIKCDQATFLASVKQYNAGAMVQTAFPYLNSTEREFMISGLTPEEQKAIFG